MDLQFTDHCDCNVFKNPMPQAEWNEKNMRYAMCFFPVVGVVIGSAEFAAGYALLHWLHCKPLLFRWL